MVSFLERATKEIEKVIQKYIEERFYNMYDPKKYQRTYQLYNSVTHTDIVKTGECAYEVVVYLDTSNVMYEDDEAEDVFYMASKGYHGNTGISTEGKFWDEAVDDLENGLTYNMLLDFKKYLLFHGITVK